MRSLFPISLFVLFTVPLNAADWPSFRGPSGIGETQPTTLPLSWGDPDGTNILWRSPLPHTTADAVPDHNQSSPVVAGDRLFVTTASWPEDTDHAATQPTHHVSCYDTADGTLVWDSEVPPGPWTLNDLRGGYAVPTPVVSGDRLFAVFGSSVVHALDLEGNPLWSHVIARHESFDVALATSPVVFQDTVLLLLDRKQPNSELLALDAANGTVRWRKERPDSDFGHVTPVITTVDGSPQLLTTATNSLQGIDPTDGTILWSCDWGQKIWPVSSPVVAGDLVYAIGGRGGHPGLVVDPSGSGDVTSTHTRWIIGPMSEGLSSPVAYGSLIFRLSAPGVLRCFDLSSGKERFRERLPGIDPATNPIVTPDGHIYFASAGKSVVVQAAPELKILGSSDLGDPSHAAPAVAADTLFLKGKKFLYAIRSEESD